MTEGTAGVLAPFGAPDGHAGTGGPRVEALERAIAERVRARYAVAVGSATTAFHLVYRALALPARARVLTSPVADPSVVRAALGLGLAPRFADVDVRGHVDPAAVERHVLLHGIPALIVAGHLRGHPCDVAGIAAAAPGALIVEDATDAFGAVARVRVELSGMARARESLRMVLRAMR